MREWDEEISQWLLRMKPEPALEARLIYDARRRLDDHYRMLLSQGATEQEAYRATLAALNDGSLFAPSQRQDERPFGDAPVVVGNGRRKMLGDLWRNLRYGARMLVKNPGFSAMAVLTLGLGIGATTAIFSVVYATLFEPMPYPKPDQLMMVWTTYSEGRTSTTVGDYLEWKRRNTSFQYIEAWAGGSFNVATQERPEQVDGSVMTPGFFRMTGTRMFLGRDFLPEEGEVGKERVVILSHRLWNKHFGANREIIGQQVRMNGEPYTVVGVAPPGMHDRLPHQLWVPLAFKPDQINHDVRFMLAMGRLKDGVSQTRAAVEMKEIARQLAREHPNSNANLSVSVEPLKNNFLPESTIKNLWMLLGAVGFLLLIACVNVANLLLARGTTRQREVAIRAALGASRWSLFRQFITESFQLAVVGGALGVYFAWLLIDAIIAILPENMLPSEADIRISVPVLLFTITTTALAGLLFGCAPAWQASRLDLNEAIKQGGRTGAGAGRHGVRRALVVVEFALALTLLAGGGLALRSFWNLTRVDLGVRTERVLTFFLPAPSSRFSEPGRVVPYYQQLLGKIEAVPGVVGAAVTTGIPTRGAGFGLPFTVVGSPPVEPSARPDAGFQMVTPGYFETFGIRVVKGRRFTERDTADSERVAMVNEHFANRHFSGVDPLAQRILVNELIPGSMKIGPPVEWRIVGVFHNVRNGQGLRRDFPEIYVPFWQSAWPQAAMAVRTAGDPAVVTRSIAAAVNSVDPDLPLAGVKTMDQQVGEVLAFDRFGMVLYGSFAALALLLAAVGIYGVMAFAVSQRTHEFGLRMALGAGGARILSMVLREGGTLAFIGLGLGLIGAYLVGRAMHTTLYGVNALDVGSFGAAAFVLLLAAMLACYVPARRASKVDPMVALRAE
ncbi:MAG TPA: ABC transporter permease [Blastocatellia bacterium]|nr:ABC transporter permease [Blastocatellia bacterium]